MVCYPQIFHHILQLAHYFGFFPHFPYFILRVLLYYEFSGCWTRCIQEYVSGDRDEVDFRSVTSLSVIMEISRGILFQVFPDRGLEHVEITGGGQLRSVGPDRYMKEKDLDRAGANVCTLKRRSRMTNQRVSQGILTYPNLFIPFGYTNICSIVRTGTFRKNSLISSFSRLCHEWSFSHRCGTRGVGCVEPGMAFGVRKIKNPRVFFCNFHAETSFSNISNERPPDFFHSSSGIPGRQIPNHDSY